MFGYVTIRKDDLKVKDYNKYQAYYCGLCQDIKEAYGKKGQAMLTFDMTFLSILLTGLYECETKEEEHYCFLHPGKKHKCLRNKYTKYCADMNVLNDISDRSGKWYFLHAIANSRLGNNINAVQDAEMAVKLEPQNLQYQQLLSQLRGGGQWYSDMGSGYGYERSAGDLGKWCCECMAINAICNCCCCGGRGFFCC